MVDGQLTTDDIYATIDLVTGFGDEARKATRFFQVLDASRRSSCSFDKGGPTTSRPSSFPQNGSQTQHIFRDATGHLADTPANRALLQSVANNPRTTLGTDRFGNTWSARTQSDGSQVWVQSRNGIIQNGRVNITPRILILKLGFQGGENEHSLN